MTNPDLISLVLSLRPLPFPPQDVFPLWWGRAAHALLLNVIRQYNPPLAEALHDGIANPSVQEEITNTAAQETQIRPFTVSTLIGRFSNGKPNLHQTYRLRITAFQNDIVNIILQAKQNGPFKPGSILELDYLPFRIEEANAEQNTPITANEQNPINKTISRVSSCPNYPWEDITCYQEISAPFLLAKQLAPRRIALQFTSPTTFKSGGRHVPIPLPGLVFGSLLDKWNAFAPVIFPPEARRYAEECMAVSKYRLSTRQVPVKSGGMRMGAVGDITYACVNYDRYWMSLMAVLARFALFAGVGAGATMGLGQCRQIPLSMCKPSGQDTILESS